MEVIKKYLHKNAHLTKASGILILALFVFGVLAPVHFADAILGISLDVIGTGVILSIISGVLSFLVPVAAFLAGMAGSLMYAAIHMDMFYTRCTVEPCYIDIGWNLTRDFVNIALIIGLVVIAFFTIIGNQSYSAGKTLVPFIAVAILVNFSQVFVGVVVDLSNIVMGVFVSTIPTLTDTSALWTLSGTSLLGDGSINTSIAFAGLLKIIVSIIFFIGLAFIFFLYSVIFLVRFMVISLLTIVAPLALAAWIFPSTKKVFNMWRDQLVQWSFIGIPVLFFLWISLLAMAQFKALNPPASGLGASGTEGFFASIFPSILLLVMLYITFAFAMKSGAMGSSMIISQGKKWGKAAAGATRGWAAKTAAQSRVGAIGQKRLEGVAGSWAGRLPIVGGGVRGAAQFGSQKIREAERSKEAVERASQMNDALLTSQLKTARNSTEFKALFDEKIKRGDGKDIDELRKDKKFDGRMSAHVKNLSLRNQEGNILETFPEYAQYSRNVTLDREHIGNERLAIHAGYSREEARSEAYASQRSSNLSHKKALSISDMSLSDAGVIRGLQNNKNIDLLSDMATSSRRMEKILEGFVAKNKGDRPKALEELAKLIKTGNIKNAESLFSESDFRNALATQTAALNRGFLTSVSNTVKSEDLQHLFESIRTENSAGFAKIYADVQIKALMEDKVKNSYESSISGGAGGGGAAGGGGQVFVPPAGQTMEAMRKEAASRVIEGKSRIIE